MRCFFEHYRAFPSSSSQPSHTSIHRNFPCRHCPSQGQTWRKDDFPYTVLTLTWGWWKWSLGCTVWAGEAATKCLHSFSCNLIPGFSDPSSSWIRNGKYESSVSWQRVRDREQKETHFGATCNGICFTLNFNTWQEQPMQALYPHILPLSVLHSTAQPCQSWCFEAWFLKPSPSF